MHMSKAKTEGGRCLIPSSRAHSFHSGPAPLVWIKRSFASQGKTYRLEEGINRYTSPVYAPIVHFHNSTNNFPEMRGRKWSVPFPPSRHRLRNTGFCVFLTY